MKFIKSFFINFFKVLVVVLAVLNLVALFVFDYKIPEFLRPVISEYIPEESLSNIPEFLHPIFSEVYPEEVSVEAEVVSEKSTFHFESDPLIYDGTTTLDLLDGVSVTTSDESISDLDIFVHIKTGSSLTNKIVEYSADTLRGQITATRELELKNYSGPALKIPDTLPDITEDQLNSILSLMSSDEGFYADDGYGNDISNAVTAEYTIDSSNPSIVHYIFSVTNSFNDTVSVSADLTVERTRPVILLSTDQVTIRKGDEFNPLEYIVLAEDVDGTSLFEDVSIEGELDLRTPGRYTLSYYATSYDGTHSLPRTLTVVVQPE